MSKTVIATGKTVNGRLIIQTHPTHRPDYQELYCDLLSAVVDYVALDSTPAQRAEAYKRIFPHLIGRR